MAGQIITTIMGMVLMEMVPVQAPLPMLMRTVILGEATGIARTPMAVLIMVMVMNGAFVPKGPMGVMALVICVKVMKIVIQDFVTGACVPDHAMKIMVVTASFLVSSTCFQQTVMERGQVCVGR